MAASPKSAPRKYLFETSFEPEVKSKTAAKAEPAAKFLGADLERARAEGLAAGREAGRSEAMQEIEQTAVRALAAIGQQLSGLHQALLAAQERQSRAAIEVAAALTRKLFPGLARRHGLAEIEALAGEAMERLREEPRIAIRSADALLDQIKDRVGALANKSGYEGRIVYLAQDGMAPGDVRVEWADGGVERDSARQWRDLDALIRKLAGDPEVAGDSARDAPDGAAASD